MEDLERSVLNQIAEILPNSYIDNIRLVSYVTQSYYQKIECVIVEQLHVVSSLCKRESDDVFEICHKHAIVDLYDMDIDASVLVPIENFTREYIDAILATTNIIDLYDYMKGRNALTENYCRGIVAEIMNIISPTFVPVPASYRQQADWLETLGLDKFAPLQGFVDKFTKAARDAGCITYPYTIIEHSKEVQLVKFTDLLHEPSISII